MVWAGLLTDVRTRGVAGEADATKDSIVGAVIHAFADHPANPYHRLGQAYDAPAWRFGSRASDTFWSGPAAALGAMTHGPVLILAGDSNDWSGAPLQARHGWLFLNTRMEVIEGAGHDTYWDRPEATLAAIKSFLAAPPEPRPPNR